MCMWVHVHTCPFLCEGQRTTRSAVPQELTISDELWVTQLQDPPVTILPAELVTACIAQPGSDAAAAALDSGPPDCPPGPLPTEPSLSLQNFALIGRTLRGPSHSRDMKLPNHFQARLSLRQRLPISVEKLSTQSQETEAGTYWGLLGISSFLIYTLKNLQAFLWI